MKKEIIQDRKLEQESCSGQKEKFESDYKDALDSIFKYSEFDLEKRGLFKLRSEEEILDYTSVLMRRYFQAIEGDIDEESGLLVASKIAFVAIERLQYLLNKKKASRLKRLKTPLEEK
ncbi:hypothetical protein LEP1GSC050_0030 [Leptospira phage vB_LbrZ_5399-LE1]|uniref:Uncharacterized protein n=1 Tax=Leptospira inadai serovar Lyme TaxID=293084 RepID=A0ABX4YGF6_9LEPT|nr:hypothetical protein [Leptospira inadai]AGS80689.1 hypothetical protein LEP1GSC050_0030 [Leptospira phage vB_LbrZ_5399-LE1]AGS80819.1 hypothetical protein LEP1GSC047_0841 [Leptospira phage vB_LinZ_10-LE1]PNV74296.1 hypothetical protein BES34_014005 [Leptospira inadai serovar Lyme]